MSQETGDEGGDSRIKSAMGGSLPGSTAEDVPKSGGMMKRIDRVAYRLFGGYFEKREDNYAGLRKKINQARMETGYDMYLSRITLLSIITGLVGAFIGVVITILLSATGVLQSLSISVTLPQGVASAVQSNLVIIVGFIFAFVFASILAGITGGILYYIPSFYAGERKRKMENTLPQAVTFMYALSRGGMNILEVMRNLAESEDVYGEVAKEFDMILRDMDYFGNDLRIALRNAAEMTPSDNMNDFLNDLLSVIDSGGEMTPFLLNKSEQYHEIRKQNQKSFLDTLALMSESYVTAFVAAPLFIIIIMTIMSIMGGASLIQLYAIIYMVIPIASFGFAFVINIISTGSDDPVRELKTDSEEFEIEDLEQKAEESDDDRIENFVRAKKLQSFKEFLRDPLAIVKENPMYSLGFTVPVALLFIVAMVLTKSAPTYVPEGSKASTFALGIKPFTKNPWWNTTALFVIPLFIMTVPLSFFHEIKKRREKKIIRELPETLKKLESANDTGMTLKEAIDLVSETSSGVLAKELDRVHTQIEWNTDMNEALIGFANRMRIPRLCRTIKLITKANEASGNIRGVLQVAARDVDASYKLDRERFQNMIIYTVIIIISFLVFLFVIVILDKSFLSKMAEVGGSGGGGGGGGGAAAATGGGGGGGGPTGMASFGSIPIDTYRMVFFHAGIIQGFTSGIVAGQMGEDDVVSGLKYGIVMALIALIVFAFI
ncbi:MAG: type II secretion system F family protein [Halobacteria archaeon]|nr:type II secretion system F family protein [Halobacteria archaeon]